MISGSSTLESNHKTQIDSSSPNEKSKKTYNWIKYSGIFLILGSMILILAAGIGKGNLAEGFNLLGSHIVNYQDIYYSLCAIIALGLVGLCIYKSKNKTALESADPNVNKKISSDDTIISSSQTYASVSSDSQSQTPSSSIDSPLKEDSPTLFPVTPSKSTGDSIASSDTLSSQSSAETSASLSSHSESQTLPSSIPVTPTPIATASASTLSEISSSQIQKGTYRISFPQGGILGNKIIWIEMDTDKTVENLLEEYSKQHSLGFKASDFILCDDVDCTHSFDAKLKLSALDGIRYWVKLAPESMDEL